MLNRPPSSVKSIWWNPSPLLPSRFSSGTRQSSKYSSPVSEALHIIFLCIDTGRYPGVPLGTRMQLISFLPSGRVPVTAWTIDTAASGLVEFVMKILLPLITHDPSSRVAEVFEAPASLPAFGSVRPKAESFSPVQSAGSHSRFCSSLPK